MDKVLAKLFELAEETALVHGVDVDDMQLVGSGRRKVLRVSIDTPKGVTLDECGAFSRDFSALLDVEDPIKGSYTLEVSSPGLDRPLKGPDDFLRFRGKLARVVTKNKIDGQSFFVGRIVDVTEDHVELLVDEKQILIAHDDISRARLEVEI
jgi:ribosome maturation factor RimP